MVVVVVVVVVAVVGSVGQHPLAAICSPGSRLAVKDWVYQRMPNGSSISDELRCSLSPRNTFLPYPLSLGSRPDRSVGASSILGTVPPSR